jgi:hypothetical protein
MFLPTHELLRKSGGGNGNGGPSSSGVVGDWGAWAPHWLAQWEKLPHCYFWDSLWYGIFARLAKHDVHGESA